MSKALVEAYGALAEALESAAAAARKLEAAVGVADAKSGDSTADGVAGSSAGSKGKKGAAAEAVAEKPAKGGRAKATPITFEMLKAKFTELMNAKGKDAVREILSNYGAAKLLDIDESDFAKAHADVVAAIAEEDEPPATDDDDLFGE